MKIRWRGFIQTYINTHGIKIFIFLIAMHSEYDLLRFFKKFFAFVCNLMMLFARMNNGALEVFIIE